MPRSLPIVFACSGCSNAGQLAGHIALELSRRGAAEMSCLAGVGAAKPHFLKQLKNREVWVVDGCPINCSLGVFEHVCEHVDVHIRLHDLGVKKSAPPPTGCDLEDLISAILQQVELARMRNIG